MLKRSAILVVICATSATCALAQTAANYDPKTLEAAHSIDTPAKMSAMIKGNFHINPSSSWPSNFPLPVYASNLVNTRFFNSTSGQPMAAAMLITKDSPKQVFDFYQSACIQRNWRVQILSQKALAQMGQMGNNDNFFTLKANKEDKSIFLTCAREQKTNGTLLSISWQKKKK